MKIAVVQGTRPEIIKNYSIVGTLRKRRIPHIVLHTDQHNSPEMRDDVYRDMGYRPDQTFGQTARIGLVIQWLQQQFEAEGVTHVIANGDTAAALSAGIASLYSDLRFVHIEAGLRSADPFMLEERNRIMVDAIANTLFAYTEHEVDLLRKQNTLRGKVYMEGNTTVDLITDFAAQLENRSFSADYIYLTLHRRELTNNRKRFASLLDTLSAIADTVCPMVFPVHPRTADALDRLALWDHLSGNIRLLEPQSVFDSLALQFNAVAVATDSGCIQEEAYILGTPCITLRENTERHLTITHGANRLTGFDPENIRRCVHEALTTPAGPWPEIYGKPGAGERMIDRILQENEDFEPLLASGY